MHPTTPFAWIWVDRIKGATKLAPTNRPPDATIAGVCSDFGFRSSDFTYLNISAKNCRMASHDRLSAFSL